MSDQITYVIYKHDGDVFKYSHVSWVSDAYNARQYDLLSAIHYMCSFCEKNGHDPSDASIALLEVVNGVINYEYPVWISGEPLIKLRPLITGMDGYRKLGHVLRHDRLFKSMNWLGYR